MTLPLEMKMNSLAKRLKARCRADGTPKPGFKKNVADIRAEMELISGRIELAKEEISDAGK